jgi:hypothetical protein
VPHGPGPCVARCDHSAATDIGLNRTRADMQARIASFFMTGLALHIDKRTRAKYRCKRFRKPAEATDLWLTDMK